MTTPVRPRILIESGKLCSGKSTLTRINVEHAGFLMLTGETTRAPRTDDVKDEFRYLSDAEFDALPPEDMLWATRHGAPSRYTLLRSVVDAALADIDPETGEGRLYTRPLAPASAGKLIAEYGDVVRVIYLPSPSWSVLAERLWTRDESPVSMASRIASEADWDEIARNTPGICIAEGHTLQELHDEGLALMGLPPNPLPPRAIG